MNGLALCAGYGGIELGIERVFDEYRTVCYVEGEAFAAQHLIKKMEEGALDDSPIWSNVRTFNGEPWRGKVDIITGGFPCQPYSSAGKQMAEKDPRDLWPDFVRIIGEVRPGFIFFENVPGIVKWRLDAIILDLNQLGYNASWCVVAASDVGALHRRKRWFLFGVRNMAHTNHERLGSCCRGSSEEPSFKGEKRDNHNGRSKCFEQLYLNKPSNVQTNDTHSNHSSKRPGSRTIQNQRNDISRLCQNVSDSNGERRNKVKLNIRGGKLDVEGRGIVSHAYNGREQIQASRKQSIKQMFGGYGEKGAIDKWEGRFESWWEIEPSMGRLVDGAADWVDKLRILGNGVVPQQAAYALQILGERLAWGMVENRTPKD